jgi:hypothetical protein
MGFGSRVAILALAERRLRPDTGRCGAEPTRVRHGDGGDLLSGGNEPDPIDARDGQRDTVDCGEGVDVALAESKNVVHGDWEVVKVGWGSGPPRSSTRFRA